MPTTSRCLNHPCQLLVLWDPHLHIHCHPQWQPTVNGAIATTNPYQDFLIVTLGVTGGQLAPGAQMLAMSSWGQLFHHSLSVHALHAFQAQAQGNTSKSPVSEGFRYVQPTLLRAFLKMLCIFDVWCCLQNWEIPVGRRFRSLKLWFVLRAYGQEKLQGFLRCFLPLSQPLTSFEPWLSFDSTSLLVWIPAYTLIASRSELKFELHIHMFVAYVYILQPGCSHTIDGRLWQGWMLRHAEPE